MAEPSLRDRAAGYLPGVAAVAATYTFFLLWVQFGFVALLRERLAGPDGGATAVRAAMAAMGIAGLAASLGTAALLARVPARRLVRQGLLAAPLTAVAALACRSLPAFVVMAAATGAATALLTVALAAGLRTVVRGRRLGLAVGTATGGAYLLCNLPPVFAAPPRVQALLVAAVCVAGWRLLGGSARSGDTAPADGTAFREALYRRPGLAAVVAAFLALVWIDSAAFAAVQESPGLAAATWGTAAGELLLGAAHLAAAVAAGALLDLGLLLPVLLGTAGLFAVALPLLGAGVGPVRLWGVLYALGISAYSTALVVYPGGRPDAPGTVPARWRAGLLYGVAGWLGSALGVGMAQDLHRIPGAAVAVAVAGVAAACRVALGGKPRRPSRLRSLLSGVGLWARLWAPTLLLAVGAGVALLFPGVAGGPDAPPGTSAVARGRRVYRAEGCIHCHSQYVRPGTRDEVVWGPHRPLDRSEVPPLVGVRRQGPDLANVGNRRSRVWQRLHLQAPRLLDPGSRMPSYAHLFTEERPDGTSRGDDLVAYLDSLGRGTAAARLATTRAAPVPGPAALRRASAARGERLFGRYCAPCHGARGRGDGPLAAALHRPGMDLGKGALWSVSWGPDAAEAEPAAVARLIRFGIDGSPMPGHESLTPEQVADLTAYVERVVHGAPGEGTRLARGSGGP